MNRLTRLVSVLGLLVYVAFASQGVSQAQASNKWLSLGQMTQARSGAAAVLLTDGRVLITGGTDSSGVPQGTAEVYDPTNETFTAASPMNVPRANHAAIVLISGDVLVTGGLTTGGGYSDSAEIYSVSSQQWTLLPSSIGVGLADQAMALLSDGNILIAGGTSTTKVVGSIVLFNFADKTFTPIGTLLTPRTNAVAAATPDGRVLIAGGADINGAVLASTEIFTYSTSTLTGTVAAGPTMTSPRVGATATSTYDGVAVIGGNNGQNDLGTAEIFSQWTNTFKLVSGGTPRSHHFAVLLPKNGSILAMGGTGGAKVDLLEPWANSAAGAFLAAPDSLDNQDGGFGAPAGLGSFLAAGGTGDAAKAAELYSFPTVSTQNLEYAPGTTVDMSGTGFQPNETVDLHIHEWVNQTTEDLPDATVTANVIGDFSYDGYSPNKGDIGARYHLTAVGTDSGFQAQTIFGDGINSIDFSNPNLNQAINVCGALTLTVGGGAPYGTIYLYDSTTTGSFYTSATCTGTAITQIAGAATVTLYYTNTTASTPDLIACNTNSAFDCEYLAGAFGVLAANQLETIYGPKLAWTVLPSGGAPGAAFGVQPVLEVLSASGTVLTTSTAPITLKLTGGGTLSCSSNPLNATAGVATFSGCSVTPASANQYCLVASSPGIAPTGATDACFYVTAVSAGTSSVTANPGTVPADGASTSTITVTVKDTLGNPVVGKTITLTQGAGASVIITVSGSTDGNGVATFTVTDTTVQTVTYTATDTTDGSITIGTTTVNFSSTTTTLLIALPSANPVTAGVATPETLTATLTDAATGAPLANVTVTFTISTTYGGTGTALTNASGVATYTGYSVPATAPVNTALTVSATSPSTTISGVTYAAATGSPTQTITVGGTLPALTWTTAPPASEVYHGTFPVVAKTTTTGDTGTITYTVTGACTISTFGTATVTMQSGAGSCYVTATIAAKTVGTTHYTANTLTATVTATKANQPTLTVTGAPASAADGATFTVGYSGGSGTGAVTFAVTGGICTVSGTQVTMTGSTGSCSITVTQAGDNNYNSATSAAVIVIAASGSGSVVVTCSTLIIYNGSQPTNPCSATTTPSGLTVNFTYSSSTYSASSTVPTNAGTYTVVGTISDPNYTGTGTGGLTISPVAVTAIAGSVTNTYTGANNIPVSACTVEGQFIANVSCTDNPAAVGSTVGSGAVQPAMVYSNGDIAANYTPTYVNGTWVIGQASSTTTLACPASVVYSGAAQTPCTATVTVTGAPGVTGLIATTQYVNNTNVGIASAVATFPGNGNVASSASLLETFQITALPATITLGNVPNEPYTGNQATVTVTTVPASLAYTISYTGVAPTVYAQSSTPPVNPGTYTVVATITDPNYSGTTGPQTLIIGPIIPPMILSLNPGSTSPSLYGTAVSFNLDVNNGAAPAPCPTGSVQFYVNGTASGLAVPLPLTCDQSLFYQIATLPLGSDTITATYFGDLNYPLTTSNPLTQVVSADTTGVILTSTATGTINVGGAVTFTATVTPSPAIDSGASGPGGTVQFYSCAGTVPACDATDGNPTPLGAAQTLSNASPYTAQLVNPALAAGTYSIGATYTSSNGDFSGSSGTLSLTVTVGLNIPKINWDTPASIVYGTALTEATTPTAGTQLDATATDPNTNATVPGTFAYLPVAGTVLDVNENALNVTFTPTDGKTYSTAGASVTLDVLQATLTVTADNQTMSFGGTVPTLTYTITGCVNGDSCGPTNPVWTGTATCSTTATNASPVGGYPITCSLGGLTASNYTFTFVPGIMQVTAGTSLTIETLPTASNITYGQTLVSSVLTGGTAFFNGTSVTGTFAWAAPTTAPPGGTNSYSVTFTANSSSNYNIPTAMVSVTVLKADPAIATTLPTAAAISVGQALSASGFTGGSATFNGTNVPGQFAWTTPTFAPTPAGSYPESVTFTPTDTTDYNTVTGTVTVQVNNKTTPTVTVWPTAAGITYGQTLASSALNPVTAAAPTNASVVGTFTWSTPTTVPGAGTPTESVTFTPTDTTDYNTVAGSITVAVAKATPTIATAPTAAAISVGQALSASVFTGGSATNPNGGASVPGAFAWTTPTLTPAVGTADPESVTFTPTDTTDFNTATLTVNVTVNNKTTPTVTVWPTASGIIFGQTLAASVLTPVTATVPTIASVVGTFAWTTPTTAPGAGTPSESVTFTPTDTTDYNTVVNTTISVTVAKATPTIATPPTASAISLGQTLSASTLTPGTATFNGNPVPGLFTWTTPTLAPTPAGNPSESVTFTPTDTTDYNTVTTTVPVAVNNKTTPTITAWPTASGITYGQTLASSTLSPVSATVPTNASVVGTFTWTAPATAPGAGTPSENVTFTPTDTTDYNTVTGPVTVTVAKATPTIGVPPTAGALSVGQALSASVLTGGTVTNPNGGATVVGAFAWTTPGTVPPAGTATPYSVTFTPTDTTDYNSATTTVSVTVNNKTTPTVTAWPTASSIIYGQTLASSVLTGGTASVAGTFAWTTPTTVPGAGTPAESVTFTPTDTTNYNTVTNTVTVTVNKATPTIGTPPTASVISVGQPLSASTLTGGTATNPNGGASVVGTYAWTTQTTVPPAGTNSYSVTFTPTDTTDYTTTTVNVAVTANNKTTPTVTIWPTASAITYGQTLASSTLNPVTTVAGGNASVAGTFTWTASATAPGAGTLLESVTFTPTDTTNYNTVTGTVTVAVAKATPTIAPSPTAGTIAVGQALSASVLTGGTATNPNGGASVLGAFAWTTPGTVPPAGTASYSVTFTPTDTTDYNTATTTVSVTVGNKTTPTVTAWPTAGSIIYGQTLASSVLTGGTASVAGTFAWTTPTTVPGAGTPAESVTFTPTDTTNYNTVTSTISVTVNKATPTIGTPPTAGTIAVGQTLASSVLTGGTATNPNGGASVTGNFAWTTQTTVPPAGTNSYSVTFTPTDTTDYTTTTVNVSVTANNKTTPTVTGWPTASAIIYGQTLAASTLNPVTATVPTNASVAGTFTWTASATAPGAGAPLESVTFTPTDTTNYNTVTSTVTVTVNKATPTIAPPPTAGAIAVGQALSASVLTGGTATNPNGGASVLGAFAWTTPGTVPPAGTASYSVTFTPTDTTDYNTATTTVSVTVGNKTTPTVSAWPTASAIIYGQTLASSVLSPVTAAVPGNASVAGTFTWTAPTTVPGAGTPSESVTFTPTDTTNYNTVTGSVTLTVSKDTPTVSTLPIASAIASGQTLALSTLTGGTADFNGNPVLGTFAWTTLTTVPPLGTDPESVTFTPTDTTDYNAVIVTVSVTVNNKATPTVTAWPTAGAITYGQTLASSALTGGTASVAGTFSWTSPLTAPGAGTPSESVTFTPTDTTNYNTVSGTVTVTVNKATPTVTAWPTAGTIAVGQTLTSSTLAGGTASVAGTFTWTTPTTAPALGADSESVTFTPTDTTDYDTVTGSVTVTVNNKTTATVTAWPTASVIYYGQTLASSLLTGGTGSVAGTFTWTTPTTAPGAGSPSESVTFTPTDTTDYNTVAGTVTVTVDKVTPTVTAWPTASAIAVAQTLASSTLTGGTASVPGTFSWTTPTTAPGAGTTLESVTFTPTDTTDYNTAAGTVTVTVNKAAPTVTAWPTAGAIGAGQTLASSLLIGGTASVPGTFSWTTPTTVPPLGTDSESVTFTPYDTTDYNTVTGSVTVTVNNKTTPTVTAWPTAEAITSGQTLASSSLTGGAASVAGLFTWTVPATVPASGTDLESVTFTPADTNDYNPVIGNVTIAVNNKSSSSGTGWPTAGAIVYGQTLASSTLTGGTPVVAGTFYWTTPATVPGAGNPSESVTFTPSDPTNHNTATGFVTVPVNEAPLTIAAVNASRVYGTDNPAFTGGITGAVNGDVLSESYSTVATTSSSVGTYPIVPSVTGTNVADYAVTVEAGALTITQAGTTTTLNASSSTVSSGQSVTLTAQVASVTTGTPTGSVAFYQGATLLGTATLTAGTATLSTSSITSGASGALSAVYSGDNNFTTSTSATFSIGVSALDFAMTVSGPTSLTVTAGSAATYQMAVNPLNGNYPGPVSFTASGLPSGASVTFNPTTIAANDGKQTVTLVVQTAAFAKLESPSIGRKLAPLTLALFLIPLFGVGRLRRQGRRLSKLGLLLLLVSCTLAGAMMTGCGGSSGAGFKQVAQNYTITVTATSGKVQHTAQITLELD